jgi:hypothetical protein
MRTKLIISLLLFAGILIFLNWAAGRYLASIVTGQFDRIVNANEQMDYSYERVFVNPALGSLTIRGLTFRQQGRTVDVNQITGSLTHADLWRVLRKGSHDPLAHIHSFRIRAEGLEIHDAPAGSQPIKRNDDDAFQWLFGESARVRRALFFYNGRMDELMQLAGSQQPPGHNHRISISLDDITFHEEIPDMLAAFPVFSGYRFPDNLDQVALQIRYKADQKTATLNSLRITAPDLYLRTNGEFIYEEPGWPWDPGAWNANYMLRASTRELNRLPLPQRLGSFNMDTLSVTSRLSSTNRTSERPALLLPGETSAYLGTVRWYPSNSMIQQYGMLLGMFGLPENELPIRSLRANWKNENDTLRIENTVMSTDPFDAKLDASVAIPPGQRANVMDGSLTFTRTSAAFNDFVDGVEGLFRITFPRRDGRIYIEFHGDPMSPTFPFVEEFTREQELDNRLPP